MLSQCSSSWPWVIISSRRLCWFRSTSRIWARWDVYRILCSTGQMFFWHLPGMLLLVFQGMTLDSWKDYQICRIASGEIGNSMYLSEKKYVACYLPSFSKIDIAGKDALARTTRSWASSDSLAQINMKHSRFSWVVFSWDSSDTRTWQHLDILWTQERDRSHTPLFQWMPRSNTEHEHTVYETVKNSSDKYRKGKWKLSIAPIITFFFFFQVFCLHSSRCLVIW